MRLSMTSAASAVGSARGAGPGRLAFPRLQGYSATILHALFRRNATLQCLLSLGNLRAWRQ